MSTLEYFLQVREEKGAGYLALIDPDKVDRADLVARAVQCAENGVDALLIGSSLLFSSDLDEAVGLVKRAVNIPVVLFPGMRTPYCFCRFSADVTPITSSGRNAVRLLLLKTWK